MLTTGICHDPLLDPRLSQLRVQRTSPLSYPVLCQDDIILSIAINAWWLVCFGLMAQMHVMKLRCFDGSVIYVYKHFFTSIYIEKQSRHQ